LATHYETLGVSNAATAEEIKTAYRKLAKENHPDKRIGDSEAASKFNTIQTAYDVLSDANKRATYDASLSPHKHGFGFDIFDSFFGQRQRTARGRDVFQTVEITLEDVYAGCRVPITVEDRVFCAGCDGRGFTDYKACSRCSGSGKAFVRQMPFNVYSPCGDCQGTGRQGQVECAACKGEASSVVGKREVMIDIPKTIEDGTRMVANGMGHPCKDGLAGNLIVGVKVKPHKYFTREGLDLLVQAPFGYSELILGLDVIIPCFGGKNVVVTIPPGTQPDTRFRVKNAGLVLGERKGDVILSIKLTIPKPDGIFKEFAERMLESDRGDRSFIQ
jgi:molecular chaperone DnaJ